MKYKKLLCLSLLALVAGCQGMMIQEGAAPVNPGGDVTLTFNRESKMLGITKNAQVYVGNVKVCVIYNGKSCTINTSPGMHVLKVDATFSGSFGTFSQSYQFDSGKAYRFVISPNDAEMVADSTSNPIALITAPTYYEFNKTSATSDNGDFTMKPLD
jgi:hypothetical protein